MRRLSGLDASFLYLETPSSPMHVAGLMLLDPSTVEGGITIDKAREVYASRLHLAPPFRWRLAEVPFGLHHPVWVADPDFELGYHIRHIAVPAPGGPRELSELVSRLVAIPLDRRRPLWEVWLIDGLSGGDVAVLTKVHHAAIDGASGNHITVALLDLTPEIAEHTPCEPWAPERVPSDLELLAYAAASLARQPLRVARALGKTAAAGVALRRRSREAPAGSPPPAPFSAPRTSFNRPISPRRSYAYTSLPLPLVKAVKNAAGCTVNDVVLALCAGALRRYLLDRGEAPEGPLVAMVPISVRSEGERDTMGNRVAATLASLATDVEDPCERLRRISQSMQSAKRQHEAIGADTLQEWLEFPAPALAGRAARLYSRMRVADRHRPIFNLTISNLPGPAFPLYSLGARMVANYPIGPIAPGLGLNVTVMSYLDQLDFGLLACPDVLADTWSLAAGLQGALDELAQAAGVDRAGASELSRARESA